MERRFISVEELSEYLNISKNTVYSWVSQRKIPYLKAGRSLKFDLRKMDEWITENSIEVYE